MKTATLSLLFTLLLSIGWNQNHSKQSIRFIFETEHDIIGNFETNTKKIKLYNHQNHLCYEADLFEGKELDEIFFYYDKKGKLVQERRIFSKAEDCGILEIRYDKLENTIEEIERSATGDVLVKISMEYDKMGNMTHKERASKHQGQNELLMDYSFDFSYSAAGELLTKKGFTGGNQNDIYIFKFSNQGEKQIIEKFDAEGQLREKWMEVYEKKQKVEYEHSLVNGESEEKKVDVKYGYDDHGNLIRERIYKNDQLAKTITFEYQYDPYGNWTEKVQFEGVGADKKERARVTRRIEYFKTIAYEHPPMEMDETFTIEIDQNTQEEKMVSSETHVRINDEKGNVNWVSRRNGATIYQCDESEYNEEGQIVKTVHLNNEKKENAYTLFEYNSKGQMTQESSYSFADKIDEKVIYTYNAKDELIKKEQYVKDPSKEEPTLEITEEYEYDADGNRTKGTLVEYGEEYSMSFVYKGDKLVEYIQTPTTGEEAPFTEKYSYTGENIASIEIYEDGEKDPREKEIHKFNGDGDIIKSQFYEGEKLVEVINYEYFE